MICNIILKTFFLFAPEGQHCHLAKRCENNKKMKERNKDREDNKEDRQEMKGIDKRNTRKKERGKKIICSLKRIR